MRDRHEFGDDWSLEDGMIRCLKISYLKGYALSSEVFPSAEGDGQGDLPKWYYRGPGDYTVER